MADQDGGASPTEKHPVAVDRRAKPRSASLPQALREVPKAEIAEAISLPVSPRTIDRFFHAALGRLSLGVSPAALMLAYVDWLFHLSMAPGKQAELAQKALRKAVRFAAYAARAAAHPDTPPCIQPLPRDTRFDAEAWQSPPYTFIAQAFLLSQQ